MAYIMRSGFAGTHNHNDINQGLRHVPNMEGESSVWEGRDRGSSVSVGRVGKG